jgi:hypothetical protein
VGRTYGASARQASTESERKNWNFACGTQNTRAVVADVVRQHTALLSKYASCKFDRGRRNSNAIIDQTDNDRIVTTSFWIDSIVSPINSARRITFVFRRGTFAATLCGFIDKA